MASLKDYHPADSVSVSAADVDARPPVHMAGTEFVIRTIAPFGYPDKVLKIGGAVTGCGAMEMDQLLSNSQDIFAWSARDLKGVPPEIAMHSLNIDPHVQPVTQRRRKMSPEKAKAAGVEVRKLLEAGFIQEIQYSKWLSNVVLVKKASGKWRMCVDFKDLNKACMRDCYPLPPIDELIDAASEHQALSFLDAYSGYNQISMNPRDEPHTAFITSEGTFCYKVMPFGLRNVGATFQRLVDKVLKNQLGRTVSAYVDDILVKSKRAEDHSKDLEEVFRALRASGMSLNPEKCIFGVGEGKFLGFMISERGIDVNPARITAISEMRSPLAPINSLTKSEM